VIFTVCQLSELTPELTRGICCSSTNCATLVYRSVHDGQGVDWQAMMLKYSSLTPTLADVSTR